MFLLIAVILGLGAGYLRSKVIGSRYQPVELKSVGLVLLAFLPQFAAFYFPQTRSRIPDDWIPFILVGSQTLLLWFAWRNRRIAGIPLLGLGLLINLLVIGLNGGMMPLPPENAHRLIAPGSGITLEIGERAGFGKDIVLPREQTRLWFLGDIFMLPDWLNYPLAFSPGDILISMGAFWLLWELGKPKTHPTEDIS